MISTPKEVIIIIGWGVECLSLSKKIIHTMFQTLPVVSDHSYKTNNSTLNYVTFVTDCNTDFELGPKIRKADCTCVSNSQLQGATILGHPVGFGASSGGHCGHRSGRSLARNLNGCPQQIYFLPMHVLHVVL